MDEHEIKREKLVDLVPKRTKARGKRPGPTTTELGAKKLDPDGRGSKVESKWTETDPERTLTEENKRLLLATVMMIATRQIFKYHVYTFAGEVYRQLLGGPIRLRFTSIVACIVMDAWMTMFLAALIRAGVQVLAAIKYVDNINLIIVMFCLGTRWCQGELTHKDIWEQEDIMAKRTPQEVTMEAVRLAAESILPWLEFTADDPTKHLDSKVPMLDIAVWIHPADSMGTKGFDTVGWTFYQKPSASKRVLLASSAYNWRSKLVTINMEVFRRMKNMTRQTTPAARVEVLCDYVNMLRCSGYVERTVEGMIRSGLKFYQRKIEADLQGGPPLCTRSEAGTQERRRQKLGASEKWYSRRRGGAKELEAKENGWRRAQGRTQQMDQSGNRRKTQGRQRPTRNTHRPTESVTRVTGDPTADKVQDEERRVVSTLLVPYSIGSILKRQMQETDDEFVGLLGGGRVCVVESGGTLLAHMLCRSDPWATLRSCDDPSCDTCRSKRWLQEQRKACKRDKTELPEVLIQKTANHCTREGVNYSLQCLDCALEGVAAIYWGESGLSARQRHQVHRDQVDRGDVTSPMVVHSIEMHGGRRPNYLAMISQIEARPLYRAARESIQISEMPENPAKLNRCQEWGAPRVPILTAVGGDGDPHDHFTKGNPRPEWTQRTLKLISTGACKRIRYWDGKDHDKIHNEGVQVPEQQPPQPHGPTLNPQKKIRLDLDPDLEDTARGSAGQQRR